MKKHYKAFNSSTQQWVRIKLTATDHYWELAYDTHSIGDMSKTSENDNFNVAYANMLKYVEDNHLVDLAEE